MATPSRITWSLSGVAVAVCHRAVSGAPVLVVDDGAVSLRLDLGALSSPAAVGLVDSLARAADDLRRLVRRSAESKEAGPDVPPPPYTRGVSDG